MSFSFRALPQLGLAAFLLVVAGCGSRTIYPVEGHVIDQNGKAITELAGCSVEFEHVAAGKSAIGTLDSAGRFRMTTERPGDGAWLGTHKVHVTRPENEVDERPKPRVILQKYEDNKTSGLSFEVRPESNNYELKVERIGGTQKKKQ